MKLLWLLLLSLTVHSARASDSGTIQDALLNRPLQTETGDLDTIRENGMIRVLTTYNRTNFFFAGDQIRGFEYELLRAYEEHLNQGVSRREIKTVMVFVPVAKDQLIPYLLEGRGDIAAAGLTITPERLEHVAFTNPYLSNVDEIVVTRADVEGLDTIDDLAGRKVYVVATSSYVEHLSAISERFTHFGRPPIDIIEVERYLETEDILEMVNAGIVDVAVADRHLAELWSGALESITLRADLAINTGGGLAWAVRKDNPQLLADLNTFVQKNRKGSLLGNVLFKRYYEGTKWIKNPVSAKNRKRLDNIIALFQEYGEQYDIDWMGIAALAFQESRFKQNLKSSAGAVGVMQIKPATAGHMGIDNIQDVRNNIHAGVKYLDWLRTTYFNDPEISPESKIDFVLASYNAGARRVMGFRNKAPELGYDPNRWFQNVERVALRKVGQETVQYVANINKYYVAIKLAEEKRLETEAYQSQ